MSSGKTFKLNSGYEIDIVGLGTWKVSFYCCIVLKIY